MKIESANRKEVLKESQSIIDEERRQSQSKKLNRKRKRGKLPFPKESITPLPKREHKKVNYAEIESPIEYSNLYSTNKQNIHYISWSIEEDKKLKELVEKSLEKLNKSNQNSNSKEKSEEKINKSKEENNLICNEENTLGINNENLEKKNIVGEEQNSDENKLENNNSYLINNKNENENNNMTINNNEEQNKLLENDIDENRENQDIQKNPQIDSKIHLINWNKISEKFVNKNPKQCQQRWQNILDPNRIKGSWTEDEDKKLIELIKKLGPHKWSNISEYLPGRLGKQCRERWFNHLNPNVRKTEWTKEEEWVLFIQHKKFGNSWSKLSAFIPGRTDNTIKNHWNSTMRKSIVDISNKYQELVKGKNAKEIDYIEKDILKRCMEENEKNYKKYCSTKYESFGGIVIEERKRKKDLLEDFKNKLKNLNEKGYSNNSKKYNSNNKENQSKHKSNNVDNLFVNENDLVDTEYKSSETKKNKNNSSTRQKPYGRRKNKKGNSNSCSSLNQNKDKSINNSNDINKINEYSYNDKNKGRGKNKKKLSYSYKSKSKSMSNSLSNLKESEKDIEEFRCDSRNKKSIFTSDEKNNINDTINKSLSKSLLKSCSFINSPKTNININNINNLNFYNNTSNNMNLNLGNNLSNNINNIYNSILNPTPNRNTAFNQHISQNEGNYLNFYNYNYSNSKSIFVHDKEKENNPFQYNQFNQYKEFNQFNQFNQFSGFKNSQKIPGGTESSLKSSDNYSLFTKPKFPGFPFSSSTQPKLMKIYDDGLNNPSTNNNKNFNKSNSRSKKSNFSIGRSINGDMIVPSMNFSPDKKNTFIGVDTAADLNRDFFASINIKEERNNQN